MELQFSIQNVHHIEPFYYACWEAGRLPRAPDMADFGPPVEKRDPLLIAPPSLGSLKRVSYVPVPRRGGKDAFPSLAVFLQVLEEGARRAVTIPALQGAAVTVEVVNLWDPGKPRTLAVAGGSHGARDCRIQISADTVRTWLDPDGPLGARINENLLEFRFRIPALEGEGAGGQPFAGESQNRVYLYRRKAVVFFPGVFGSQVQFTTPDGQKIGFPDFLAEDRPGWREADRAADVATVAAGGLVGGAVVVAKHAQQLGPTQKVGVLECDSAGEPLLQPDRPTLLTLFIPMVGTLLPQNLAYDVFRSLHAAVRRRFSPLPEGFRLFTLFAAPYDWRLDLTRTALDQLRRLEELRDGEFIARKPDTDDRVALIGHSTGGLVVRRMLVEAKAEELVSQAFFMNVPFRGAPKTLAVIATGCDPLGTEPNLPFVDPRSMRAMALTSPIVYHLSASERYSIAGREAHAPVVFSCSEANGAVRTPAGLDAERAWVELAIRTGFVPSRKVIPASAPLSKEQRKAIALHADDWNDYWEAYCEHRLLHRQRTGAPPPEPDEWAVQELAKRGLTGQNALRVEQGWNEELARAAVRFHETCEEWAQEGKWQERCFLFYSASAKGTTVSLEAKQLGRSPPHELEKRSAATPFTRERLHQDKKVRRDDLVAEEGIWIVGSLSRAQGELVQGELWRFATLRGGGMGDKTVPLQSQLGFGGPVQVFKRLGYDTRDGAGPDHLESTKDPWAWDRILDVLQGDEKKVKDNLAPGVDPKRGTDGDERLNALRRKYVES